VALIAATQRRSQKAMGKGALRSQMDVRVCFQVRERKDVDLILGQGMLTARICAIDTNAPTPAKTEWQHDLSISHERIGRLAENRAAH